MDPARKCPRCAAPLEVAPLSFTLAYACSRPSCGLVFCREKDAGRVAEELAALRGTQANAPAPPFSLSDDVRVLGYPLAA